MTNTTKHDAAVARLILSLGAGEYNQRVSISALKERAFAYGIAHCETDAALLALFVQGCCCVYPNDNTRFLTQQADQAALVIHGERKHLVKLERLP